MMRGMANRGRAALALVGVCFAALLSIGSCSREEAKPLDVNRVLGSTLGEVIERWGEPKMHTPDQQIDGVFGYASWPDVQGAKVTAFSKEGKIIWVTYRFPKMDPFDEAEAFRLVNVDPAQDQARLLRSPGAKRWTPFGKYQKLTVSPATKMVAAGEDPLGRVTPSSSEGVEGPT